MCEPGDNVIVVSPGNPKFSSICTAHGVQVKQLILSYSTTQTQPTPPSHPPQTDTWDYNLPSLPPLIDQHTKFLYILNPNYSIGQLLPDPLILQILSITDAHQIPIIVDETFSAFPFPTQKITKFGQFNLKTPIISINSASRLFGLSGLNFGWIVFYGHEDCFSELVGWLNRGRDAVYGVDDVMRNCIELCWESIDKVGYCGERMKICEIRNLHFHKIFGVEG